LENFPINEAAAPPQNIGNTDKIATALCHGNGTRSHRHLGPGAHPEDKPSALRKNDPVALG